MQADRPLISAIVVSYNTREMTLACLRALYASLGDLPVEVWVVDNASRDGSSAAILQAYPKTRVIENARNVGFGAANNQAMRQAQGEFFLLINSDAFPQPGAIASLLDYLRSHPDVAVVGPRLIRRDGSLQCSCFPFPSPLRAWLENMWISTFLPHHRVFGDYRRWAHDTERLVDHVIGACMLVRQEAYRQVGGFDERFFMYSEETDWEKRMHDQGWRIGFTPHAQVVHLGGASGVAEKARIDGHFFDSMDQYELKHYGLFGLLSLRLAMTIGCFLRTLLWGCVLMAVPQRRATAAAKFRLHSWLFVRQSTHWRLRLRAGSLK